jgi:nucleoside 2-deoxyribosyltransferase
VIYFAAPLFSEAELAFNAELAAELEAAGHEVFLPQRDGVEADKPPYSPMAPADRRRAIFELDRGRILACDVFLIVLDGRVPDEGATFELGLAYAHRLATGRRRRIVGLQSDCRAAFLGAKLNPMLVGALDVVVGDRAALIDALAEGDGPRGAEAGHGEH